MYTHTHTFIRRCIHASTIVLSFSLVVLLLQETCHIVSILHFSFLLSYVNLLSPNFQNIQIIFY